MIYVTGDYHGGIAEHARFDEEEWPVGYTLDRDDVVIIAGDFGLPWDFSEVECEEISWLESRPWTTVFVDGNHERYDHWADRPVEPWCGGLVQRLSNGSPIRRLMRGEVYEIEGVTIFTLGGATSIDKKLRTPYVDWWPQELPDQDDFAHADENLEKHGWCVDHVITHACSNRMLPKALFPSYRWETPDTDPLTDYLDTLESGLTFSHWYCGHYHVDRDLDDKHTVLYDAIVPIGRGVDSCSYERR